MPARAGAELRRHQRGCQRRDAGFRGGCQVPRRSRAAWTMWPAEIPAASMSSCGGPGAGQAADRQVGDLDRVARVVERFEHRAADAALPGSGPRPRPAGRRSRPRRRGASGCRSASSSTGPGRGRGCRRGRAGPPRPGSCAASRRRRSASPGRPGWTGRPWRRRSGTPRPARTAPGTRRGWCACRRCRCGRPSPAPGAPCCVASLGYRTVDPCTARIIARSSRAICDGPSAPISTPAWEPHSRMFACGDGRHPDEVVGAGEERGEGGGEGDVPADGHADGGRDELLLGDEHLEVALGVRLGELLGVGGVAHLPVEGDDVAAGADAQPAPGRRPAGWRPWRPARSGAGSPRRWARPGGIRLPAPAR